MKLSHRLEMELNQHAPKGIRLGRAVEWREEALCAAIEKHYDADLKRLQEQLSALTHNSRRSESA